MNDFFAEISNAKFNYENNLFLRYMLFVAFFLYARALE